MMQVISTLVYFHAPALGLTRRRLALGGGFSAVVAVVDARLTVKLVRLPRREGTLVHII